MNSFALSLILQFILTNKLTPNMHESLVFESLALKIQLFTEKTSWIQFTMAVFRSCEVWFFEYL